MTDINKIHSEVIDFLKENLDPKYTYHNVAHTQYVFDKATHIAKKEGVSKKDIYLLQVAALFHDSGFTKSNIAHEKESNRIATAWLKKYGFSKEAINKIKGMISATKIPQQPKNKLEEIIADADLCYLGTTLFKKVGYTLYTELKADNPNLTVKQWNTIQREFISNHTFHTVFCKRYYEFRKQKNLASLN